MSPALGRRSTLTSVNKSFQMIPIGPPGGGGLVVVRVCVSVRILLHLNLVTVILSCAITLQQTLVDKEISQNTTCTLTCGNATDAHNVTWGPPDNLNMPQNKTVQYTFNNATGYGSWNCYYKNPSLTHLKVQISTKHQDDEHNTSSSTASPVSSSPSTRAASSISTNAAHSSTHSPWAAMGAPAPLLAIGGLVWCLYKKRRGPQRHGPPPRHRPQPVGSVYMDVTQDPHSHHTPKGEGQETQKNSAQRDAGDGSENMCLFDHATERQDGWE